MNELETPARGSGRRLAGLVCYGLAVFGAVLSGLLILTIIDSYRRHQDTGDQAGASLGFAFLVIGFIPSTLIALGLGAWFHPPQWLERWMGGGRLTDGDEASFRGTGPRQFAALGLALVALCFLAIVGLMLWSALHGARQSGMAGPSLVQLAFQDLFLFSPLVILSGLMLWFARRLASSRVSSRAN